MNRLARLTRILLVICVVVSFTSCGDDDDSLPSGPSPLAPVTPSAPGNAPNTSEPLSVSVEWEVVTAASVVAGHNQESYRFTANVTGGVAPYTYRWSFDDGTPPAQGNPVSHKFYSPGTYDVVVTVRDAAGTVVRSDAGGDLDIEIVASPFSLACHVTPTDGDAPLEVELRAEPTGNVGPITWRWDFGDGDGADQRIASHVYDPQGYTGKARLTATATATDGLGRSVQCSREIVVRVADDTDTCARRWVSACPSGDWSMGAIDSNGCGADGTPPTVGLPPGLAIACIDNLSAETRTVTSSYAGGYSESFSLLPTARQCMVMICPPVTSAVDGPVTLSW